MGKKAEKMYDKDKAPKLDRDDKGNVSVKEGMTKADAIQSGTEGVPVKEQHAMRDMHHRHEMEHMTMNRKHETEHHASEGKDGSMLERHISEHKEMNTRHMAELKKSGSRQGASESNGEKPKDGKTKIEAPEKKEKAKASEAGEKK